MSGATAPERTKVLYVGGFSRSGTTLLLRLLGEIPGLVAVGELFDIWDRSYRQNQLCGCGRPFLECPFWREVTLDAYGCLPEELPADNFQRQRSRVRGGIAIPRLWLPVLRSGSYRAELRSYASVMQRLYTSVAAVSGDRVIVDSSKEPHLAWILRDAPGIELHVVHQVRDSRAVAFSWQRVKSRPQVEGKLEPMPRHSVVRSALEWDIHNFLVSTRRSSLESYTLVRYEDLVEEPEAVLARIGRAIGETWALEGLLRDHQVTLRTSHTASGNPSRFSVGTTNIERDDEWMEKMSRSDRLLCTALTSPGLLRYRYPLEFPTRGGAAIREESGTASTSMPLPQRRERLSTPPTSRRARGGHGAGYPILVGELELAAPEAFTRASPPTGVRYRRTRIMVRLHGVPIGFLDIPLVDGGVDPSRARAEAWRRFGGSIGRHLTSDGLPSSNGSDPVALPGRDRCREVLGATWREPITVVVCTRDRADQLGGCLPPLQQLRYERFEVVVVDNAPRDQRSKARFEEVVGGDPRFRYVVEPRPGLSRARNRGLAEARYAHVAYTDDDELVDPLWLDGIARGFGRDGNAGCVTGLVPSAQLDTPFQVYFDQRVWWSTGLDPHVYDLAKSADESPLFPYDAGQLGTGGNFAVERELMFRLGGFDEGLGPGAPTGGADDLDAFVRILRAGRSLVYEPYAIAWHLHRATLRDLREQLFGYGKGLSAYITKYLADPDSRGQILRGVPAGVAHMVGLWGRPDAEVGGRYPTLLLAEVRGMAAGPFAYWRARHSGWPHPR